MKSLNFVLLLFMLFSFSLFGDCELVQDTKYDSYNQFKEAATLLDKEQYKDAYEKLIESFKTYPSNEKSINLKYDCVNYTPGAYAPIIQHSSKEENFDFDRKTLGKDIKEQLSPAPYVFIEFQKNKTIVSVTNATKTDRGELKGRLPLENFTVTLGTKTLAFGRVNAGEVKRRTMDRAYSPNKQIITNEDFNFKLYK